MEYKPPSILLSRAGSLDRAETAHVRCGIGSWGGRCLSLGGYVAATGTRRGATVTGGRLVLAIENRKWAGLIATVCALTVCGAVVQAQQTTKVTPIGYLSGPSLSA